jgi:hypothetical protein
METVKERIQKRAAQLQLEAIREKGFSRVANPKVVAEKIEKFLGVKVSYNDYSIYSRE